VAPRGEAPRSTGPSFQRAAPSAGRRGPVVVGRAAPRGNGNYYRGGSYNRGGNGYRVAPRYYGGRYYGPSYRFYSPWYSFRPRYSLGFGLYMGYPVYYPYWSYPYYDSYYYDDYPYPYDYSYGYPAGGYAYPPAPGYSNTPGYSNAPAPQGMPAPGSVTAQNGAANTGGMSFDIQPSDAEVFIDGNDYGQVGDFTANAAPLSLTPGRHHVEIRANGYRTMQFDADVVAGQVIPYQGTMQR
jgi:hypothetical protein